MGLLTRDQILKADDLPKETVEVPEWGGSVIVRTLGGTERDDYEQSLVHGKKVDVSNARAKLVAIACVQESGEPLFSERDARALGRKSSKALDRVFAVASRLSGISEADMEETLKNSGTGQTDNSTSV